MICKICGCTDDNACPGGCYWVEPGLCSVCANKDTNIKQLPNGLKLMPCAPNVCQECSVDHLPGEPHDVNSLYYKYSFYSRNGRWPTWSDAMAHCSKEVKRLTVEVLKSHGIYWV